MRPRESAVRNPVTDAANELSCGSRCRDEADPRAMSVRRRARLPPLSHDMQRQQAPGIELAEHAYSKPCCEGDELVEVGPYPLAWRQLIFTSPTAGGARKRDRG